MYIKITTPKLKLQEFLNLAEQNGYRLNPNMTQAVQGDFIFINKDVNPFNPLSGPGSFGPKWIILYSKTNEEFGNAYWDLEKDKEKIVNTYFRKNEMGS
jgi:hypothetical protein